MTRRVRQIGIAAIAAVAATILVALYLAHRREAAAEDERDRPVVAPSRVEQANGAVVVALDSADASRIGLEMAALEGTARVPQERLSGEVIDEPERVATLRAPVAGRLSVAQGTRWPHLGERVQAGHDLLQVSDARPIASPISGTVTQVGAQPGAIVEAGQQLLQIVDQSHPLVRVAWTDRVGPTPKSSLVLGPAAGTIRVTARLVGLSPEADPATRRAAYLYRAERAWPGATPGTPVIAFITGKAQAGSGREDVLVPDRAVVQWEGLAWAYLLRAPGHFERVRIPTDRPASGGWITSTLAPGDSVVVTGSQELLSEEFRARVTVGDESGE
jgi:biotin carboxyl carrier protein